MNKLVSEHLIKREDDYFKTPFLRLKIESTGCQIISSQRYYSKFSHLIANPNDFLQCYKKKETKAAINAKRNKNDNLKYSNKEDFINNHAKDADVNSLYIQEWIVECSKDLCKTNIVGIKEFINVLNIFSCDGLNNFIDEDVYKT